MPGGRTALNFGNHTGSSPRRISSQDCRWALFISAQKFEVQQSGCGHLRVLPILGLSRRRTARPRSQAWTTRGSGSRACRLRCTPDHVAGRHDLERLVARAADHELSLRPHAARSACGPVRGWVPWGGAGGRMNACRLARTAKKRKASSVSSESSSCVSSSSSSSSSSWSAPGRKRPAHPGGSRG